MTEEDVLLVKPPEDGQDYFSFHVKDRLLATRGEKPYDGFNAKSLHLDNYCFDAELLSGFPGAKEGRVVCHCLGEGRKQD